MKKIFIIVFLIIIYGGGFTQTTEQKKVPSMPTTLTTQKLTMRSTAFKEGELIAKKFSCDGKDVSPALEWSAPPAGTKRLALICDDPDAPMGTWVHWVIFNIPPEKQGLPEAVPPDKFVFGKTKQGKNDFGKIGYGGPCPPPGSAHRYFFKLYALDTELGLEPGATKAQVMKAMEGHILAEGQLMGTYKR